jgi:hypothetical protein
MNVPAWVKPGLMGAAAGAIAITIVGFSAGWVISGDKATKMAQDRAETAVLAALTPICVAQFNTATMAAATADDKDATKASRGAVLASLLKEDSWKRGEFVQKRGWATMPGSAKAKSEVASACAERIVKMSEKKK